MHNFTEQDWILLRLISVMARKDRSLVNHHDVSRAVLWLCKQKGDKNVFAACDALRIASRQEDKDALLRACGVGEVFSGDSEPIACSIVSLMEDGTY